MKITMYELLGMVKKGKAPKRIKITGNIYEYDDEFGMYTCDKKTYKVALGGMENEINLICNAFNEMVEILDDEDEEKELPEKIDTSNGISVVNCAYKINKIDYLKNKAKEMNKR